MGRTKALVTVDGRAMAARVADAVAAGGCEPVVVVGGDADELGPLGLAVVADLAPGEGPVGGVLTALAEAHRRGAPAAVVVACDLPWLTPATVHRLVAAAGADRVACARTSRLEPLCAVWPATAHRAVQAAFADGVRAMHVLLDRIGHVDVAVDAAELRNINTPADLGR